MELDIFSGMPNPTWSLTPGQADDVLRRLDALPPASPMAPPGHLGYRGFVLEVADGAETERVRVQRGTVLISRRATESYRRDPDRALERWLLDTGRPVISEEVRRIVERDLSH